MRLASHITPIILAGGLGSRLRAVIKDRPKPLAMVTGKPFITYLLDLLKKIDFTRVIICTGFKADMFPALLGSHYMGVELLYSQEKYPLGTGGAVVQALSLVKTRYLLILNGDSYLHCNLEQVLHNFFNRPANTDDGGRKNLPRREKRREAAFSEIIKNDGQDKSPFWSTDTGPKRQMQLLKEIIPGLTGQSSPAPLVVFLTWMQDTQRYGRVETDHKQRITAFMEKKNTGPGWINAGIYLLPQEVFASYHPGQNLSMEREILPHLLTRGLLACFCPGPFIDIGTPASFARADDFFKAIRKCEPKGPGHV